MLKRLIFWDFPRGGWQYDIVVLLILAFLFLPPREWFRDQVRIPSASGITMLPSEHGSQILFVDKQLAGPHPEGNISRLTSDLRERSGNRKLTITRVEPIRDTEGELLGYTAFVRP
jgi:hypothetical protein